MLSTDIFYQSKWIYLKPVLEANASILLDHEP